ncbi:helix-turn-helix transcriptional regulator [uncultured Clostridium sp.]|uniref:helix-turn-helix transcriptional regulator n=1 Tax=uncultured Clostridium sp. TaxID=59620 RepID=UPI002615EB7D|nr:helix-turn-helix transcriptional regulator [uncultured Clostridium sp.]
MIKNRLKEIRMREYMMNKGEFAALIGLTDSMYSQLESEKKGCSLKVALQISKKLNKSVNDIWYLE